ncbi:hypothetical protein QRD89_13975 [Halobacillus sp. ACCC02827]|uniref:Thoeris anti-defense Tad2 family protein n=1 Tax=Bacillaceae TaxID=186817 RepID=UPI0003F983FA|nr:MULTISPECIES: hypothetical protein [Bacillaceae]QHT47585.1 hypothetical protein M662_14190 [Bacillus sp. SB49]WJE14817.1 hypothetical protein QRD89_13975 [Halobacillus sp. ACCC02827]
MNFIQAVQLLDEGNALRRTSWTSAGYITKDEQGTISFFDHNEPAIYQLSTTDALADDWEQVEKDRWTIVSVSHDRELMQGRLFVSYQICAEHNGEVLNNHLIDEQELPQWARYVDVDLKTSSRHLNEKDIENVQNKLSA